MQFLSFSLHLFVLFSIIHCIPSELFNSNYTDNEFFPKLCNSYKIPIIEIKGRNGDEIRLVFTGDT